MTNSIEKYLRVFKMAGIEPDRGYAICLCLSEQTLDKLIINGMDRRIIKPILQKASNMPDGINDENVNMILNDLNVITSLMAVYCK